MPKNRDVRVNSIITVIAMTSSPPSHYHPCTFVIASPPFLLPCSLKLVMELLPVLVARRSPKQTAHCVMVKGEEQGERRGGERRWERDYKA